MTNLINFENYINDIIIRAVLYVIIKLQIIECIKKSLTCLRVKGIEGSYNDVKEAIFNIAFKNLNNQYEKNYYKFIFNKIYDENYDIIYNEII